ncbi:MAG TPA: DUF5678 domain-containing protein [Vicinamibacteria bacterium]|nr:DUF5678 domain-containing protein [Vicinamibacteria bacterium]
MDRERDQRPAPDLNPYVGEWVVIQNDTVVEHGRDLEELASKARSRGIRRPRVVFVPPHNPAHTKLD